MSKTYHTLCFLNTGDHVRIYPLDRSVQFFEGTVVEVKIAEYAEDTFILLKPFGQFRLIQIYDSNVDLIEREE